MSAGTMTLRGNYFDGRVPIGSPATLIFTGSEAALIGAQVSQRYPLRKLQVSPRAGRADRFIALPGGGQLQCADDPLLANFPQEGRTEGAVAWLEARTHVAVAGVLLITSVLWLGYFRGLPAAAERVAAHVPIASEQALGEQVVAWLDEREWFKPSAIDENIQFFIREDFDELRRGLSFETQLRLEFRDSYIGANAFALPGGIIVITDDMVEAADSLREVAAVLAHEIGHVERRHALRHLLQDSAIAVVATALTADAASLSIAVAGLPALLAEARYSRGFESEADDFAFALLRRHGRSPDDFANLMERLSGDVDDDERRFAFLSTHPVTTDRVQHARAAAHE